MFLDVAPLSYFLLFFKFRREMTIKHWFDGIVRVLYVDTIRDKGADIDFY